MNDGLDFLARRQFGRLHRCLVDAAAREIAQAEADAAHVQGFEMAGHKVAADDELGRSAADVHHQLLGPRIGQAVRDAQVDQARLLPPRDHLDRHAQRGFRLRQKEGNVLRHAQGIGRDGTRRIAGKTAQAFAKARQRVQRAGLRRIVQGPLGVESGRQAHRFLQRVERIDLIADHAADLEPETVGAKIDRGNQLVAHCGIPRCWE